MKKFVLLAILTLPLTACFEEGPPNYNERDRRAYNSLQEVDHPHYHDGYYDRDHNWHDDHDHSDDYNPADGHDHWARQSN